VTTILISLVINAELIMLKAYAERKPKEVSIANAAIIGTEDDLDNMLDLYSVHQTETYRGCGY